MNARRKKTIITISVILCVLLALAAAAFVFLFNKGPDGGSQSHGISFQEDAITVEKYETYTLELLGAENKQIEWKSNDEAIATVENGVVCGWKKGYTQILAYVDDVEVSCYVTVQDNQYVPVIDLGERDGLTMGIGGTYSLQPVLYYNGNAYTDVEFTYSSTADAVLVDENGLITAAAEGEAWVCVQGTWRNNVVDAAMEVLVIDVSTSIEVSDKVFDIYLNGRSANYPSSADVGISIFDKDIPVEQKDAAVTYTELIMEGDVAGAATVKNGVAYAAKIGTTHFIAEYTPAQGEAVRSTVFTVNVHESPYDTYMKPIEGEEYNFFIEPLSALNRVEWDEEMGAFHLINKVDEANDGRGFIFSRDYIENILKYTNAKSIVFEVKSDGISSGGQFPDQVIYQGFYPQWYDGGDYQMYFDTTEWQQIEIFFEDIPLDQEGELKAIMLLSSIEGMYIRNIRPRTEGSFLTMDLELTTLGGSWAQDIEIGAFPHSYEGSINGYLNRQVIKAGVKTTVKYRLDDFLEDGKVPGFGIVVFGGPEWNTELADGTFDRHILKITNLRVTGEQNYSLDLSTATWASGTKDTGFTDANGSGVPYYEDGALIIENGYRYDGHKITLNSAESKAKTNICFDMLLTTVGASADYVDVCFYPYGFEGDIFNDFTEKIAVKAGKKAAVKLNLDKYLVDGKFSGIGFAIFGGPEWNTELADGTPDRHNVVISGIRLEGEQEKTFNLDDVTLTTGFANANAGGTAAVVDGELVITNGYRYDGHMISFVGAGQSDPSRPGGTEPPAEDTDTYICMDMLLTTLSDSTERIGIRFYPTSFAGNVHETCTDEVYVTAGTETTVKLNLDHYLVDGEFSGIGFAVFGGPEWNTQISDGVYDRHSIIVSNVRLEGELEKVYDLSSATVATGFGSSNTGGTAAVVDGKIHITGGYRYDGHMISLNEADTYLKLDMLLTTLGDSTNPVEVRFYRADFTGSVHEKYTDLVTVTAGTQTTVKLDLNKYLVDGELTGIGVAIFGGPEWNTELADGSYDRHSVTISNIRLEGELNQSIDLSNATVATGFGGSNAGGTAAVTDGILTVIGGYRYDGHMISFDIESEPEATEPEEPAEGLNVTGPQCTVYPYQDRVKEYLLDENIDIMSHYVAGTEEGGDASIAPVRITWSDTNDSDVTKYVVEYATSADYSDAVTVVKDTQLTDKAIEVYNLYKASTYYVRVTAYAADQVLGQAESTFRTTDLGPRIMNIDGLYNVRDLGGYTTADGKTTVQGLIFRGSEMDGGNGIELTEAGNEYMSNVLGIQTDLDLRGYTTASPISSATKKAIGISAYTDAFTQKELYAQIFSTLADVNNYPVYIHCMGGADRTGTVCYLLNALLGVSEEDLIRDYEMTSYSIFGLRTKDFDVYKFPEFVEQLKSYEGDTLAEKTENYMLSIGVTEDEIFNIRGIMLGEETKTEGDTASICLDMLITTLGNSADPIDVRFYPYDFSGSVHSSYTDLVSVTAGELTTVKLDLNKYLVDGELTGIGFAIFGGPEWNTQLAPGVYDRHTVTISNVRLEGDTEQAFDLTRSVVTSGTNGTGYTNANGSGVASVVDGAIVITGGFRYDGHKITLVETTNDYISLDMLITTLGNSADPIDVRFYPYDFSGSVHSSYTDLVSVTAGELTTVKLDLNKYLVDGELTGIGFAVFGGPEWNTQLGDGTYDRHSITISNLRLEGEQEKVIQLSNATVTTGTNGTGYTDANGSGAAAVVDGAIVITNGFRYDGHKISFGSQEEKTYICLDMLITTLSNSTGAIDVCFYPQGFSGNVHGEHTDKLSVTAGTKTTVKLELDQYLVGGQFTGIGFAIFGGPEWNTQMAGGTYDRHSVVVSNIRLEGGLEKTIDLSGATVATGFANSNSGGTAAVEDNTIVVTGGYRYDGHMITFGSSQAVRKRNSAINFRPWLILANIWKKELINL